MKFVAHLSIIFGAFVTSSFANENNTTAKTSMDQTVNVTSGTTLFPAKSAKKSVKKTDTTIKPPMNQTVSDLSDNEVVSVGRKCKNDGNCKPGLKCCDAMGGNKCWECCEDVHCEGMGKICWLVFCF